MPDERPLIDKDMTIGEILEKYPQALAVFRKHFGPGCFTCAGSRKESVSFGALMHNTDVNAIIHDLNAKINT